MRGAHAFDREVFVIGFTFRDWLTTGTGLLASLLSLLPGSVTVLGLVLAWLAALTGLADLLAELSEEDQDLLFWLQSLGPIKKTGRQQLDNWHQGLFPWIKKGLQMAFFKLKTTDSLSGTLLDWKTFSTSFLYSKASFTRCQERGKGLGETKRKIKFLG